MTRKELFLTGLRLSIPIALGYFMVSIAIGMFWVQHGFTPLSGALTSALTMSSTGQFAGVTLFAQRSGALEIIATTLLVNSRYLLMGLAMSLKLPERTPFWKRFIVAFGVSDELFALHSPKPQIVFSFFVGTMVLPIFGWTAGTLTGAYVGELIPPELQTAAGFILYGMFLAIIIPPAREHAPILYTLFLAAGLSGLLWWLPFTGQLEFGWRLIIVAVIAAGLMAVFFPEGATSGSGSQTKPNRLVAKGKSVLNGIRRVQLIPRIFPWYAPEKYGDVPLVDDRGKKL